MTPTLPTIALPTRGDERGSLTVIERDRMPFPIERVYYLHSTAPGVSRGHHAHRELRQVLVAVAGAVTCILDDGTTRTSHRLARPDEALLVDRMVWHELRDFEPGTVCLLLASAPYDEADYIRDRKTFLAMARAGAA